MQMTNTRRALISSAVFGQLVHIGIFFVLQDATFASNVVQVAIALICTIACLVKAKESVEAGFLFRWCLLASSLFLWTVGQLLFLVPLIRPQIKSTEALSNVLWLLFSFPFLLASFIRAPGARRDGASWLDFAQAFLFFCTLFALVFSNPSIISLSQIYEVQSVALALAFALRLSVSARGEERRFYGNAAVFAISYALFSIAGYVAEDHGFQSGTSIDLCWTVPFTLLSLLAVKSPTATIDHGNPRQLLNSSGLHGVCAFGLATMSLTASGLLAMHRPLFGGSVVLIAFCLLAGRMIARERQLHRVHTQLEDLALCDPLTGLANRTVLERALVERQEHAGGDPDRQDVVLFIDLDRFKLINDGFGHHFGDLVLKEVANLLRLATGEQDLIARQGGDEFVVLLKRIDLADAREVADRIGTMIRSPIRIEGQTIHLSASVGLASRAFGIGGDTLLEDADCAMYNAKSLGRDRVELFQPDLLLKAKSAHALYADLREALAGGQITVHYQPIYGCESAQIKGFEALVRWYHPQRGYISPADFIPVAEETGLVVELGEYVLRTACVQCREWNSRFGRELAISVNVSARQFEDRSFIQTVSEVLKASGLMPQLLKLEITETVLLGGHDAIEEMLSELRSAGIAIALDDFGTGYSSLSYLMNFPFDIVKIDRSFVSHIHHDFKRSEIVRKVVELAMILGMRTVAEGVESVEELACLRSLKCDLVQGYLLSRPLAPGAVFALLSQLDEVAPNLTLKADELGRFSALAPYAPGR
jgi:diguanylate cyclase (GGDEF)-like protein